MHRICSAPIDGRRRALPDHLSLRRTEHRRPDPPACMQPNKRSSSVETIAQPDPPSSPERLRSVYGEEYDDDDDDDDSFEE